MGRVEDELREEDLIGAFVDLLGIKTPVDFEENRIRTRNRHISTIPPEASYLNCQVALRCRGLSFSSGVFVQERSGAPEDKNRVELATSDSPMHEGRG